MTVRIFRDELRPRLLKTFGTYIFIFIINIHLYLKLKYKKPVKLRTKNIFCSSKKILVMGVLNFKGMINHLFNETILSKALIH